MLYLAARTRNRAAVCLHADHIAALREFWTVWLPWHGNTVLTAPHLGGPGDVGNGVGRAVHANLPGATIPSASYLYDYA